MIQNKPPHKKFGLLVAVLGLVMAIGGGQIISLGGSYYFMVIGGLILSSGLLINRGFKWGAYLYLLTFVVMIVWSIKELGLESSELVTRLGMAFFILVYIFASKIFKTLR